MSDDRAIRAHTAIADARDAVSALINDYDRRANRIAELESALATARAEVAAAVDEAYAYAADIVDNCDVVTDTWAGQSFDDGRRTLGSAADAIREHAKRARPTSQDKETK